MSLESLLTAVAPTKQSPEHAVRVIATDKGMRIFLIYLCGLRNDRFDELATAVKALWQIVQNDMIATEDSGLMQELAKYPHVASFLRRVLS